MRSARTPALLGAPYLAQGLVYGFAGWILLPALAAAKVPLAAQAGVLAWGGLPWVFKALWGPLLDRAWPTGAGGRAPPDPRRVVVGAQLLLAAGPAAMATWRDPTAHVAALTAAWVAQNVLLSLQDVATDALALDALAPTERGRANAIMLGAHHVGAEALAAMGLGWVVSHHGLSSGLWAEAAILLALAPAALAVPWARAAHTPAPTAPPFLASLRRAFARPAARWAAALAALVFVADQVTSAASASFLVTRLGWTPRALQVELSPVALGAAIAGYAAAAWLADRRGHARTAGWGTLGLGATWLLFAAAEPLWPSHALVLAMVGAQGLWTGLLYAGVHALLMDRTDPRVRASQFLVFMALTNLPRALAPHAAAPAVAALGFAGLFAACGVFQASLWLLLRRHPGPLGHIDAKPT